MNKLLIALAVFTLVFVGSTSVFAKDGGSGENSGRGGGDDGRVRIEVRGEDDSSRVRFESRDDGSRVRVELRAEDEVEDEDFEIEDNSFEITGTVMAFTGGTVTIDNRIITINPSLVTGFEQEGTIEVGETIKVEGMVVADGSLLAREIEANGVETEEEAGVSGVSLTALLNQIIVLLQGLV